MAEQKPYPYGSFLDVFRAAGLNVAPAYDPADPEYLRVVGAAMGGFSLQPRPDDYSDQLKVYKVSALVYRCAQLWAESILQAPLKVYEMGPDREIVREITRGPIWDVLDEVNGEMSYHEWMYVNILNMALTGNSYTWKVRNKMGQVVELWPFRADEVEISYDPLLEPGRKTRYEWRPVSTGGIAGKGGPYMFKSSSILHLKLPSPISAVYGTSPVRAAHDDVIADQRSKRSTISWLESDGVPAGVLQTDQTLTDDQATLIKERWRDAHGGPDRRGKIAILGAGTKFVPITVTPKDIEWLNQRRLSRSGVLMSFGVPPIYGGLEGENYANRREQRLLFWQDTIRPKLRLVEAQMTEFFARDFNPRYCIMFDESRVDAFVEAIATRIGAAVAASNPIARIMRPYEARSRLLGITERFEGDDEFAAMPGQEGVPGGGFGDLGALLGSEPEAEVLPPGGEKLDVEEPTEEEQERQRARELRRAMKFEKVGTRQRRVNAEFMRAFGRAFKRLHSAVLQKLEAKGDAKLTEKDVAKIIPSRQEIARMATEASSAGLRMAFREGVAESLEDVDEARRKK